MENLDDLILAATVGTSAALRNPVVRVATLAAGVSAVAYINTHDDDPTNDPEVLLQEVEEATPAQTWGFIGGAVALLVGGAYVEKRLLTCGFSRVMEGIVAGAATYELCRHAR